MASVFEDSPKKRLDEGSKRFPKSDVLQESRSFFKRKPQDEFPFAVELSPRGERIVARLPEQ